jgi:hypothetical protein
MLSLDEMASLRSITFPMHQLSAGNAGDCSALVCMTEPDVLREHFIQLVC